MTHLLVLLLTVTGTAAQPVYHQPAPVVRPVEPARAAMPAHAAPIYRPAPLPYRVPSSVGRPLRPIYTPETSSLELQREIDAARRELEAPPREVHLESAKPSGGYRLAPQSTSAHFYTPGVQYPSGPYRVWHGPVLHNPHRWRWWQWNRYVVWYPVPFYWGGGFWGPWGMGLTDVEPYGAITDDGSQELFSSYEIGPQSPGADLLTDYGLTQTECGPPNLVVIWGPDNSVICAYPNDLVAPGSYEVDPASLTLVSLGAPAN
ncbi:MAG TPA: hypothetical protein VGX91_13110 [Candidatus Cybelea sp.]|nr:hypothetical protein [Candidatus Cybelea sp.]